MKRGAARKIVDAVARPGDKFVGDGMGHVVVDVKDDHVILQLDLGDGRRFLVPMTPSEARMLGEKMVVGSLAAGMRVDDANDDTGEE